MSDHPYERGVSLLYGGAMGAAIAAFIDPFTKVPGLLLAVCMLAGFALEYYGDKKRGESDE